MFMEEENRDIANAPSDIHALLGKEQRSRPRSGTAWHSPVKGSIKSEAPLEGVFCEA